MGGFLKYDLACGVSAPGAIFKKTHDSLTRPGPKRATGDTNAALGCHDARLYDWRRPGHELLPPQGPAQRLDLRQPGGGAAHRHVERTGAPCARSGAPHQRGPRQAGHREAAGLARRLRYGRRAAPGGRAEPDGHRAVARLTRALAAGHRPGPRN